MRLHNIGVYAADETSDEGRGFRATLTHLAYLVAALRDCFQIAISWRDVLESLVWGC